MARKKRRGANPPGKKKSATEAGFPASVAVIAGFLIGVGLTWLVMKAPPGARPPPPTSPVTAPGDPGSGGIQIDKTNLSHQQAQGVAMIEAQIAEQMKIMEQNPDRLPAEDPDQRHLFRHQKTGRWLMLLGRARPEKKDAWSAVILRDGPDSLTGKKPEEGLAVDANFELPGAEGIEHAVISETGSVVIVLTRKHFRGQGPGDLIRLVPGEGHGKVIDTDVFRFTLAEDGDGILYERASDGEDLHGKRELKIFHASRSKGKLVKEIDYPRVQVGDLGPWDPTGVFVDLSIVEYAGGFEPTSDQRYKLDGFNPTKLIPVDGN